VPIATVGLDHHVSFYTSLIFLIRQLFHLSKRHSWYVLVLLLFPASVWGNEIVVVVDASLRPHMDALASFKATSRATVKVFFRQENGSLADERKLIPFIKRRQPEQLVVFGDEALRAVAAELGDIPLLFGLVTHPGPFMSTPSGLIAGVSSFPDPALTLSLWRDILPQKRHLGTVYTQPEIAVLAAAGRAAFADGGGQLEIRQAPDSEAALVQVAELLPQVDGYWMLPDETTLSLDVLRLLFFSSKAQNKPLIGLSERYVAAGALFALNAEPGRVGTQLGQLSNQIHSGTDIRQVGMVPVENPVLSINMGVARALGLTFSQSIIERAQHVY